MSGLFGSINIKGNRLTEFAQTTATVGIPIPFGFGSYPVDGNVIFAPLPPKEHIHKKKQGKGGVKTTEYTYTLSYAVAFCEGPIFGYLTIKRNGKVVWTQDPNASIEDQAYADKWKEKATFYYGTETQMPDSTIESYKGAGNVSAFRGIAYIVVEDDDVTDNGGAAPSYEAVVIATADTYFTTPPYPLVIPESFDHSVAASNAHDYQAYIDEIDHSVGIISGNLGAPLRQYFNNPADEFDHSISMTAGELKVVLVEYENNPPDEFDHAITIDSGALEVKLISYQNNPPDEFDHIVSITGGTLS